jgi:hypothetical protein
VPGYHSYDFACCASIGDNWVAPCKHCFKHGDPGCFTESWHEVNIVRFKRIKVGCSREAWVKLNFLQTHPIGQSLEAVYFGPPTGDREAKS